MAAISPDMDLSKIPLEPNPKIPSNFINPPSLAPAILGVGITMVIVTSMFVAARLNANYRAVRKLGWDDCFCLLGLIFTIGYISIACTNSRTARHTWDVPYSFIDPTYAKLTYALNMLYAPGIFFAKAAILTLYLRIFAPKVVMRMLIYVGLGLLFVGYFILIPFTIAYCTPRHGGPWDFASLQRCAVTNRVAVMQGVLGVVGDIYIFVLPIPVISKLNLRLGKKLGILAVFMSGIFAIIASVLGLYYKVLNFRGIDLTWNASIAELCVIVENTVTIIVSCSPALASFWKNIVLKSTTFLSLRSWIKSSRGSESSDKRSSKPHGYSGGHVEDADSQRRLHRGNYLELSEKRAGLSTNVLANEKGNNERGEHITKSISMSQSSEWHV